MEEIGNTVQAVLDRLKKLRKDHPADKLKKYLTKEEIEHIKFSNLKKGVMTINVDSSARMYALNLRKKELVAKLGIKDLRLRLGEID